jgi:hypothetical protein
LLKSSIDKILNRLENESSKWKYKP